MLANRMMMGAAGVSGEEFISNGSLLDLSCTAGELADGWADDDTGEAVSSAVTTQPVANPVATAWKFDSKTSADTNDSATRSKDVGSVEGLGNTIVVSIKLYCDALGQYGGTDYFEMDIKRSDWRLTALFASDGLFIRKTDDFYEVGVNLVVQDTWQEWTFVIDLSSGVVNATCDIYRGNVLQVSNFDCDREGSWTDGDVAIAQNGFTNDDRISYIDYFKIGNGFA